MPETPLPVAGAAPAPERELDDLERRLAAFESATKRLSRTLATGTGPDPQPEVGKASSGQRLALAPSREEDISALRPAVPALAPTTGALTARRTAPPPGTSPGFTSAYGKPAIPMLPPPAAPAETVAATAAAPAAAGARPWWAHRRTWLIAGAAAMLLVLVVVPRRLFTELVDAAVWADSRRCQAATTGLVAEVPVQVGDTVRAGQVLARTGDTPVASAAADGVVTRLLVVPGQRIAAGEPVAEVAQPTSLRVVAALPPAAEAAVGDRTAVRLLGEDRVVGGTVEAVLAAGAAGPSLGSGAASRRAVVILDPSPQPPRLGQGARVVLLGRDPSPLRLAFFGLRRMQTW